MSIKQNVKFGGDAIEISPPMAQRFEKLAEATGKPVEELIRTALIQGVDRLSMRPRLVISSTEHLDGRDIFLWLNADGTCTTDKDGHGDELSLAESVSIVDNIMERSGSYGFEEGSSTWFRAVADALSVKEAA